MFVSDLLNDIATARSIDSLKLVSLSVPVMANYSTNEFKSGLKVMLDGNPCSIMENEYVKPGKGQAFNRVKLRNLKTGKVLEKLSNLVIH